VRDTGGVSDDTEWYWDLGRNKAVRADERGPADLVLGPYASRAEAEDWKSLVDQRNEGWEEADEEWHRDPGDDDADG
jgi:hypothetical protein